MVGTACASHRTRVAGPLSARRYNVRMPEITTFLTYNDQAEEAARL